MNKSEEYLLQAVRRAQLGLQDSLIPFHSEKLSKLIDTLESAQSLSGELIHLRSVNGFMKSALSMEWILLREEKTSKSSTSSDTFESDVQLLNEKLFESFLGEPFDAPQISQEETPQEEMRQEQTTQEEFVLPQTIEEPVTHEPISTQENVLGSSLSEPDWNTTVQSSLIETESSSYSTPIETRPEVSPSLKNILDQNMVLGVQRFAESAISLSEKAPIERGISISVLKMISKSSVDMARAHNKIGVAEFFLSVIAFIEYSEKAGIAKDDKTSEVLHDIGDRITIALNDTANGMKHLDNIKKYLVHPKDILGK